VREWAYGHLHSAGCGRSGCIMVAPGTPGAPGGCCCFEAVAPEDARRLRVLALVVRNLVQMMPPEADTPPPRARRRK
jgi:hypothetical protein